MAKESADMALKKVASGAEDFPNLREYIKFLIRKFDGNSDGIISFEELSAGVKSLNIHLNLKEKLALMKKFDLNRDGEISAEELYKVLSKVDTKMSKGEIDSSIDLILRKIASGADDFASMKEYVRVLVTRFDRNGDGLISFDELCNGLGHFKVNLNS
jgi:Ca2+-binding EF-hand superfamily protein